MAKYRIKYRYGWFSVQRKKHWWSPWQEMDIARTEEGAKRFLEIVKSYDALP